MTGKPPADTFGKHLSLHCQCLADMTATASVDSATSDESTTLTPPALRRAVPGQMHVGPLPADYIARLASTKLPFATGQTEAAKKT